MEKSKVTNQDGLTDNSSNEAREQSKCYIWFHNTYPHLRGLLYLNHNTPRNAIDGARLKAMGMVAGVSDMTFLYNGKAIFLEFKTTTGRQSQAQKEWQQKIESHGFEYHIIRSLDEFRMIINNATGENKFAR